MVAAEASTATAGPLAFRRPRRQPGESRQNRETMEIETRLGPCFTYEMTPRSASYGNCRKPMGTLSGWWQLY